MADEWNCVLAGIGASDRRGKERACNGRKLSVLCSATEQESPLNQLDFWSLFIDEKVTEKSV